MNLWRFQKFNFQDNPPHLIPLAEAVLHPGTTSVQEMLDIVDIGKIEAERDEVMLSTMKLTEQYMGTQEGEGDK